MKKSKSLKRSMRKYTTDKTRLKGFVRNKFVFVAVFVILGVALLLAVRAATPVAKFEAENASGLTVVNDATASGGKYVQFGSGDTLPPPPPPSGMPTKQWIKDNAGPTNENILTSSGSITVTENGRLIQNVRISNGVIYVKANDVTIRNCVVTGSSSRNVVLLEQGYRNLTIEHCRITVNSGGANGATGSNGGTTGMKIRYNEIMGYADGIKADVGGLYEYNYIHTSKPPGSDKHLDGIQGSGRSNWTAQYNVVEEGAENGGNISIFSQAYNGTSCVHVTGVKIQYNYIYGGNHGIMVVGGKDSKCANPDSYQTGAQVIGNRFAADPDNNRGPDSNIGFRYTFCSISAVDTTLSGNRFESGGTVPGCGP